MFMFFFSRWRGAALLALGLGTSCASREVPARFPKTSPASIEAPAGELASVNQALEADPAEASRPEARPASAQEPGQVPNAHEGHHGHQH